MARFLCLLLFVMSVVTPITRPVPSIAPGTRISLSLDVESVEARVVDVRDLPDYSLYIVEAAAGPLCGVSRGVPVAAIPLRGHWDERADWSPAGVTLACVTGAIGKCAIWGYRPWEPDLRAYHQACIRMVRADYCGDGKGHTQEGTPIDVWDAKGIQRPANVAGMRPEAAWGPDGATRVWRTRFPSGLSDVLRECPDRMGRPRDDRPWLLANASYPGTP